VEGDEEADGGDGRPDEQACATELLSRGRCGGYWLACGPRHPQSQL